MSTASALEAGGLSVTFGGQRALDDVSLRLTRGTVTALLGMNGSGKSTLIKVLAGVYTPDAGSDLSIFGRSVALPLSPRASRSHGLRFLHQDLGLIPQLTVADNFALVNGFPVRGWSGTVRTRRLHDQVAHTLQTLGIEAPVGERVDRLAPATRTMVAIARALHEPEGISAQTLASRILVLDEPTASLPADQVDTVMTIVGLVRDLGGTVVYVSHRTDEVLRLADEMVVLRDGKLVDSGPVAGLDARELVTRIVGRQTPAASAPPTPPAGGAGGDRLVVQDLSGIRLRDISFRVGEGEILGVAGLVGCGRSELVRILGGAQPARAGRMELDGRPHRPGAPRAALRAGVASVPQERRRDGVVMTMSVAHNLTLGDLGAHTGAAGVIDVAAERAHAQDLISRYAVRTAGPDLPVGLLSGGNQQKVVMARAGERATRLLLLDEPSQGVDAHAKAEIAQIVRDRASAGVSVVLASSDADELVSLCHRVLVLDRGRIVGELAGEGLTADGISYLGAHAQDPVPPSVPSLPEQS